MPHEPVLIELSLLDWQGLDSLSPIGSTPRMRVQILNYSSKDHDVTTRSYPLASRMGMAIGTQNPAFAAGIPLG
jgi:hypothetical protein